MDILNIFNKSPPTLNRMIALSPGAVEYTPPMSVLGTTLNSLMVRSQ